MDVQEVFFKKILYATDLSEVGRHAFAYAASLARRYKADLTVFHVVEEGPNLSSSLAGYMDEKLWEEIKTRNIEEARQILINRKRDNVAITNCIGEYCEVIQNATPDKPFVTYDIEVKIGNPVEQIVDHSKNGNYDLIVMGHIGHGRLHDSVLGSNVQRVLRRAKIPVLIVNANS